jgi:hypothetical protein
MSVSSLFRGINIFAIAFSRIVVSPKNSGILVNFNLDKIRSQNKHNKSHQSFKEIKDLAASIDVFFYLRSLI